MQINIRLLSKPLKLICIVVLLFTSPSFAQNQNTTDTKTPLPLNIQSDSAEINQKTGINIYIGHVKVKRGNAYITGDKATTHRQNNQIIYAHVIGSADNRAHYWTEPTTDEPAVDAHAQTIYYYPLKNELILVNDAEVQKGHDVLKSTRIIYNSLTKHMFAQSAPGTQTFATLNTSTMGKHK